VAQFPSRTSAYGIWSLQDQRTALLENNWPIIPREIVTSGLVSYLDARNAASYSGSGTTWTDLSGNSINGTLSNDVSYSNGTLVFSLESALVSLPANSINTNSDFTQTFINKPNVSAKTVLTLSSGSNAGSLQIRYDSGQIRLVRSGQADMGFFSGFTANNAQVYNITLTRSGDVYSLYVNGVFISTRTHVDSFNIASPLIGDNNYPNEGFDGNMYACLYYDRALTSGEIYDNYLTLQPPLLVPAGLLSEYSGTSTNHGTGLGGTYGICFNHTGSKFYTSSYPQASNVIRQFTLTTPYDIATASLEYNYGAPYDCGGNITFNNNGLIFFYGDYGTGQVIAVNLNSAYDLSTITGYNATLTTNTNGGWWFNNDGTKLYATNRSQIIYRFNLSTPYDLSTASARSAGHDVTRWVTSGLYGGKFSSDGTILYVGGRSTNIIHALMLSTPYDETTVNSSFSRVMSAGTYDLTFSPDYELLVTGAGVGINGTVYSYNK
jgi:hypothetical protein